MPSKLGMHAAESQPKISTRRILSHTPDGDAAHIALATAYGMDILLTWNCRHIANAAIVGRLRRLALEAGYTLPEIYTPEELLGT